jgi:hypothetical protein
MCHGLRSNLNRRRILMVLPMNQFHLLRNQLWTTEMEEVSKSKK